MIVTLSLSLRVLVNAEALNMAEAVGNYTRHRKAPVVITTKEGYSVVYVPAVSGESLAHSYQLLLTKIARNRNPPLPVTKMDELGYFLKFSDENVLKWYEEDLKKIGYDVGKFKDASLADIEKAILKTSVVADVGGFLYAAKSKQVKRTSAIRFSYMLPTIDAIEEGGVAIIPQLHTRYAPPELIKEAQMLFYLESGSALYTFSTELVASDISKTYYGEEDQELKKQKLERIRAAVDALIALVDGLHFGAKRSRYQPLWDVRSLVVALSKGPVEFIVSPGLTKDYNVKTYERAVALTRAIPEETINIFVYNGENLSKPEVKQDIKNVSYDDSAKSHTEALVKAREKLLKIMELY